MNEQEVLEQIAGDVNRPAENRVHCALKLAQSYMHRDAAHKALGERHGANEALHGWLDALLNATRPIRPDANDLIAGAPRSIQQQREDAGLDVPALVPLLRRCGVQRIKLGDLEIEFQPGQMILTVEEASVSLHEAQEQRSSAVEPPTAPDELQQPGDDLDLAAVED